MGLFSFVTQDTKKSIPHRHSGRRMFTVYMIDNKGNKWQESNYNGYGEFGGKDFFELLAEMNGLTTRDEGIDLAYSGQPYVSPNLVTNRRRKWVNEAPNDCENQGF